MYGFRRGDELRRVVAVCMAVLAAFAVFGVVRKDASSETYSQVVDNSDEESFASSRSWRKSDSGKGISGEDFRFAQPAKKGAHALFEVPIPSDGEYAVYVRWPEVRGLNDRVPVGVETAYGTKWVEVDQSRDGGLWVRIGEFEMRRDEEFPIRISHSTKGRGYVAADAVKVEKVSSYEEPRSAPGTSRGVAPSERAASATGASLVEEARKYMGTRYLLGGLDACKPYSTMDCSCLTRTVVDTKLNKTLPDDPATQFSYGAEVSEANLRPGDLVFFDETSRVPGIDHAGIYSGNGKIIHASNYFGEVVESEMEYIRGYAGARRLV